MKFNPFKKNPYNQPPPLDPPPAPTEEKPRRNGVFINEADKAIQILVYQNGDDSIAQGLGALEMAKDLVKSKMTEWHIRQKSSSRILVPSNGKVH